MNAALDNFSSTELLDISKLKPAAHNPRTHSKRQIKQIERSIRRFGFTNPVIVDDADEILARHGRVDAARNVGLLKVPCVRLSNMSPVEKRAYVIADNKLAINAGWDGEILAAELQALSDLDFDVELTGFEMPEIDLLLSDSAEAEPQHVEPADACPDLG
jgi:ParB-like chromosome segregation protein Spo0J